MKRSVLFKAMWTRDERCRQIIENTWDPLQEDIDFQIQDKLKSCQIHLQRWNRDVFENVNKILKGKQKRLQELEALNMLHETTKDIELLRKENNQALIKEEVMWSQISKAL